MSESDEKPVRPGDLSDEDYWEPQRAAQQAATEAARVAAARDPDFEGAPCVEPEDDDG